MKFRSILAAAALVLPVSIASSADEAEGVNDIRIVIKTDVGEIEATIFASKVPVTAANFLNLASRDYYDGLTFHRVLANFMIQGGDPSGTGRGGPGYQFEDEIDSTLRHTKPGIFSMANAGPATNGSQFFITHEATQHLNGKHAVFGEVTKGQDVVNKVKVGSKIIDVEILDSTEALFADKASRVAEWNDILDRRYPSKKKVEAPAAEVEAEAVEAVEEVTEEKPAAE